MGLGYCDPGGKEGEQRYDDARNRSYRRDKDQQFQNIYDLWEGSQKQVCSDFFPNHRLWPLTCRPSTAAATHVPEVERYYIPGGESTAFSLFRNNVYDEADQAVGRGLAQAQHTIDSMQVMFTMEMGCDLNLMIKVCFFEQAPVYLEGLMQAVENGAHVRLIVKLQPFDGIESFIAIRLFQDELRERGLSDQVEIRLFNDPVHYKTTLVDDEFLIVGSQNFHYSAFGENTGLTEYSLGVADPQAVEDFKKLFAVQWERATPLQP
jgi:phosphatidylserine/phosphatidylglycerophosphate/cardiolipin synthase-like enzyme